LALNRIIAYIDRELKPRKFENQIQMKKYCNASASFICLFFLAALIGVGIGCDAASHSKQGKSEKSESADSQNGSDPSVSTNTGRISHRTKDGLKILRLPIASDGPGSLDPADGSTLYDNRCVAQLYETLVQYKYLKRPLELEPLLLETMPEPVQDGLLYRFKLKKGIRFHDDPCFEGGTGRELTTDDVFYSWKRLADSQVSSKNWWLLENTILGLDEAYERAADTGNFDYEADIEGMRKINEYEFEIEVKEASPRFMWTLAMFQMSIVPREAVEKYGSKFAAHPVGSGPFTMKESDWARKKNLVVNRNPNYHEEYYPDEFEPEDEAAGFTKDVGKRLPLVDRIETIFYSDEQPMWLEFRSKKLGFTTVPSNSFKQAFNVRTKTLKPIFAQEGWTYQPVPLLDFIFIGFNMEDEVVGGYTEDKRNLRRAMALAIDMDERNYKFFNDTGTVYDGPIPPGLAGYPENGVAPNAFRGPDLDRAKLLLAAAGYPGGKGLPDIEYVSSRAEPGVEMAEMTTKHLSRIGVELNPRLDDFSAMMEEINKKKAKMFAFAWGSDYPDAENNLSLFYGPNESPGSNHFNYKNPEYDKLYEQIRGMQPSDERTEIYIKMRDMIIDDCPYIGSMARVRPFLVNPHLKNFKATEDFNNWYKYLNVD